MNRNDERGTSRNNIEDHKEKEQPAKRTNLRRLLAGGAAITAGLGSSRWEKPIVNAVLLPVHAQLSGSLSDPCILTGVNFANGSGTVSGIVQAVGTFSPAGRAMQVAISIFTGGANGTLVGGGVINPNPVTDNAGNYSAAFNFSTAGDFVRAVVTFADQSLSTEQTACSAEDNTTTSTTTTTSSTTTSTTSTTTSTTTLAP
jgi:hypothetical protein